jgi:GT2 family glycosyltransferase
VNTKSNPQLDLSIIIVSWNVADLLASCLDSIFENATGLQLEVIVVDSASSDHSVEMIKTRFPQVNLLAQTENLGFSRCNNIGLAAACGRHLLLLNPDTEVIGDTLMTMAAYLDANPAVGIVGPRTLNTDGSIQSTRRRFPTLATGFFESTWFQAYAPKQVMSRFYVTDAPDDAVLDVDWVQGSALMARREVYERIGGLDEGFVMYSEELDWCRRAKNAGWRVVYLGTTQIVHHGGKSSEQVTARRHIHFHESKLRYFRKYHGRFVAEMLRVFLLLNYVWQIGLEGTKGLLGHKPALRRQRIREYWQVLRSGLKVT